MLSFREVIHPPSWLIRVLSLLPGRAFLVSLDRGRPDPAAGDFALTGWRGCAADDYAGRAGVPASKNAGSAAGAAATLEVHSTAEGSILHADVSQYRGSVTAVGLGDEPVRWIKLIACTGSP